MRRSAVAGPHPTQISASKPGPYLFRSYDHWGAGFLQERNPGPADNIPIWQVARATTAAPTYFDPISIQNCTFGDGGLGSNNPVSALFWEVATMHGGNPLVIDSVVSIGTGEADGTEFHDSGYKKISSYLNATKALATDAQRQHDEMETLKANAFSELGYHRFNLPNDQGLKNMKLDEWKKAGKRRLTQDGIHRRKESTIDKITRLTRVYCQRPDVKTEIERVAASLVQHRRSRCSDQRKWELWSTGVRYRCTLKNCDKSQKLRGSKQDLEHHIRQIHKISDENPEEVKQMQNWIEKGTCHY